MSMAARYLRLFGAVLLIVLLCHSLLPRLSRVSCFEVVQNNLRQDIDATAYFYTELDDFSEFERAVRQIPSGQNQ